MLQSALVVVAAGSVVAQTYPDQLDFLRGADTTPQIEMVLDTSGSMNGGNLTSTCEYYYNTYIGSSPPPGNPMSKLNLLKAVLTGCREANDGLFDTWGDRVLFAVREFGTNAGNTMRTDLRANFFGGPADADGIPIGSNVANLHAAVLGLNASGLTPLARAYELAGRHFGQDFSATNSRSCRQNFVILMSDGAGNMSSSPNFVNFNFVPGQPPLSITDTNGCFTTGGCGGFSGPFADSAARYMVRDSSGRIVDALPGVPDTVTPAGSIGQPIRTYTIGFDPDPDSQSLMFGMAVEGEGLPYLATGYEQLSDAFTAIITDIVPRAQVAFSPGTVQNAGLFSGNFLYQSVFQPVGNGYWYGTVKKHCVLPASETDDECLFEENAAGDLVTNPRMMDQWTNTRARDATTGGSGEQIFRRSFGVTGPTSAVPSSPYTRRAIMTWRTGQNGYVRVDDSASFTNADTRTSNQCEHFRLINKLHGFTDQVTDCEAGNFAPVGFDTWVQGDTANGGTVLLKYSDQCESASSNCFVLTNANDGMLHVIRAYDGEEVSAVIPGELWGVSNVNHNQMRDIMDQPTLDHMKRFYFDGGLRLFHRDSNFNGYIDGAEKAYLIAGLGRGGYAYYLWDVSSFNGDFSSISAPAPKPLFVDEATGLRNLRETWAAPWLGVYRDNAGNFRNVAAFASGHQREFDDPNAAFAAQEIGLPSAPSDTESSPHALTCAAFGLDATLCAPPLPAGGCVPCNTVLGCPPVTPPTTVYCYDWPGYAGNPLAAPFDDGQPTGHDVLFGPFDWSDAQQEAYAYRVVFNRFQLQPNDYMEFLDENQRVIGKLEGSGIGSSTPCSGAICSPWIYSDRFFVRLVSDGNDDVNVTGWEVAEVEVLRRNEPRVGRPSGSIPPISSVYTRPSIYMMDLDAWASFPDFAGIPGAGDTRQRDAVLVRITSSCDGLSNSSEICIDATGSAGMPAQPDLQYMVCPISAELSVFQEGDVFRSAYVGDECAQIWKIDQDSAGGWTVKRLLRLNNAAPGGRILANQRSEDYRKIYRRLELVLSRCNGSRSLGVVFGTGNLQRAADMETLTDSGVVRVPGTGYTNAGTSLDFDVVGVVWDSPNLESPAQGLSLAELENVTNTIEIANPTVGNAVNGYFIEIAGAKMLREPVVLDNVVTLKVNAPVREATECLSGQSVDEIMQFDLCDAAPVADGIDFGDTVGDSTLDRITWQGSTDIGGGLLVFTPPNGEAFVSVADTSVSAQAALPGRGNRRPMRVYLWRTDFDI